MLAFVYSPDALLQGFVVNAAGVALGELVVLYALGVPLAVYLKKSNALARAGLMTA